MLALALSAPALALGAVPPLLLVVIAGLTFLTVAMTDSRWSEISPPTWLCIALSGYCLFQVLPLPITLLERLAPRNAEVWQESLVLLDASPPEWASISIDPGATLREALKWAYYAALLHLTMLVVSRWGLTPVLGATFAATSAVAIVTLAHGALGAERIYGFFERSFSDSQWALSPLINSNNLAGYLTMGFFVGLALLVDSKSIEWRALLGMGMALMATLALTSGSRGAVGAWILGILSSGVILGLRFRRGRRRVHRDNLGLVALLPFVAATLAFLSIPDGALVGLGDKNLDKLKMIQWVLPMIANHLWFGVGAGAFETGFLPYRVREDHVIWLHPENILTGWLTELGVPITLTLIGGFAVLFWRGRRRRITAQRALVLVALTTWFLQNLVDLAVTVPGVFAAVLVLLVAVTEPDEQEVRVQSEPARPHVLFRPVFALSGLLLAVAVPIFALPTAAEDRRELHAQLERVHMDDRTSILRLKQDIEHAIRRHPGDAYLFRLRASVAHSTNEAGTLRWINRALERDMISPDTHLLLARDLQLRGATKQALLELRLAAERSPHLASKVAEEALSWTMNASLLKRAVPNGRNGGLVLLELARRLPRSMNVREALLTEALHRDRSLVSARLTLADDLVWLHNAHPKECAQRSPSCLEILREILAQSPPTTTLQETIRFLQLSADQLALSGNPSAAVEVLFQKCPSSEVTCFTKALTLSAKHDLPLERPTKYLLTVACPGDDTCAPAHRIIADSYAGRAQWSEALLHFQNAAKSSNAATDYLAASQTALRLGLFSKANRLLDQVEKSTPPPSDEERAKTLQLRSDLKRQSRKNLFQDAADYLPK